MPETVVWLLEAAEMQARLARTREALVELSELADGELREALLRLAGELG